MGNMDASLLLVVDSSHIILMIIQGSSGVPGGLS